MSRNIVKACPECSQPLVVQKNGETGVEFLGCSLYPQCTHSEALPEDVKMRMQGAATLPGFDESSH